MNVTPGRLLLVVLFGDLVPHFGSGAYKGAHVFARHYLLYEVRRTGTIWRKRPKSCHSSPDRPPLSSKRDFPMSSDVAAAENPCHHFRARKILQLLLLKHVWIHWNITPEHYIQLQHTPDTLTSVKVSITLSI